eukprot:gene32483-17723_t
MASSDELSAKIAKFEKKIKKASKAQQEGDEDAAATVTKLKKKLAKLQGESGGGEEEEEEKEEKVETDEKSKKKKKKAVEEAEEEVPKKKVKKSSVGDPALAKSLKPLIKALYTEHPDVTRMTNAEVEKIYQEKCITVEGSGIRPLLKFEYTGCPPDLLHSTRTFQTPSPIQCQVWPIIMSGYDLIGIASTGSGKTLGFGLPALAHIHAQRNAGVYKGKGPFALCMAPTRELAIQIADVLVDAGSKCKVRCLCVYGGVPKPPQVATLKNGVEFLVGTPGRLEDLMEEGSCKLNETSYLVLDEADRMLDLGFEPHIRTICSRIRSDRQTVMFSATWPSSVQQLASNFMSAPIKVNVGSQDLAASHTISQTVEVVELHARNERLCVLLDKYHKSRENRIIIFVLYKKEAPQVERLLQARGFKLNMYYKSREERIIICVLYKKEAPQVEQLLQARGFKCASIHGDISQPMRQQAVEQFKSGKIPLLIATDVAARGLDIPDVEVVINYSFPLTTEDYVHRIGRTGRAGKTGIAHTFFCASMDKPRAGELINVLREADQPVPEALMKFGTTVKKKESSLYGAHFKDVDMNAKATKMTFDSDGDE